MWGGAATQHGKAMCVNDCASYFDEIQILDSWACMKRYLFTAREPNRQNVHGILAPIAVLVQCFGRERKEGRDAASPGRLLIVPQVSSTTWKTDSKYSGTSLPLCGRVGESELRL